MCLFRNLANLGKSRSLDTEEAECSALTSCPHTAEATCRTCGGDSARDTWKQGYPVIALCGVIQIQRPEAFLKMAQVVFQVKVIH